MFYVIINKKNMKNIENAFSFQFCFVLKNTKKHKSQITRTIFKEHQNLIFYIFKNYSQKKFSKTGTPLWLQFLSVIKNTKYIKKTLNLNKKIIFK